MVGCRPRFGYENEGLWNADDDAEDVNAAVMCMTRKQGSWKRWPRVNIIAIKLKSEYDDADAPHTSGGLNDPSRLPRDATIFDVAPLVRYFQLSGSMPGKTYFCVLEQQLMVLIIESALTAALSMP